MSHRNRRDFLQDVGRGMLIGSLGSSLALELGIPSAWAEQESRGNRLTFGDLDELVGRMQDTPADQLLPVLVKRHEEGVSLRTLIAAGALANARAFGGRDYTGYHALMALAPAYQMSQQLAGPRQLLPVLKVLYRNTNRIIEQAGKQDEMAQVVAAAQSASGTHDGESLRAATRAADMDLAEQEFATIASNASHGEAFNHLLWAVQDEVDVHRVVLAWRSWAMLDLTGQQHAHTLLRQSVRYCVAAEQYRVDNTRPEPGVRAVVPALMEKYRLLAQAPQPRQADDAWVAQTSAAIYGGSREAAAEAVAGALADGFDPEAISEAISLAANQLVLRDPGRTVAREGKPVGSVHGDSVGVHASDAANAWRNIVRVSDRRNAVASLIVAAYHTGGQSGGQRGSEEELPVLEGGPTDAASLCAQLRTAVREKDQARAVAIVRCAEASELDARPMFDVLLGFATSEDGALHAEKYFRTVSEEFTLGRKAFRFRHLAGLARVTASEYGATAPGYARACELLGC